MPFSGGIFDEGEDAQEAAFQHAVDLVNADRSLLVRTRLIAHIEKIPSGDSFKASKKGNIFLPWKRMFQVLTFLFSSLCKLCPGNDLEIALNGP